MSDWSKKEDWEESLVGWFDCNLYFVSHDWSWSPEWHFALKL